MACSTYHDILKVHIKRSVAFAGGDRNNEHLIHIDLYHITNMILASVAHHSCLAQKDRCINDETLLDSSVF